MLLNVNLQDIIETPKSYLFYILLIPGIIVPLTFLTSNLNLKWYYFYFFLALPGAIAIAFYRGNKRIIGYLIYKIPFVLLGYSLLVMTGTPMFKLTGFFNGFIMLVVGDLLVAFILAIIIGIVGSIFS